VESYSSVTDKLRMTILQMF